MKRLRFAAALAAVGLLAVSTAGSSYSTFAKWASSPVTFLVNPTNADVTAAAAAAALQFAMNVWNTSGSSFRYQYGGIVSDTATAYDNRNVVFFRNATNGSAIATTYSWWDSNKRLLDSDIIIWDSGFNFFTGTTGCGIKPNAAYIEDVATHEFGHALGLNHSTVSDATMYPSYSYCSQAFRTLASDDIAGVRSLYPAASPVNTAPVVTITSPANGSTVVQGTTISLAATASDAEEGNISSRVQWTDNGVGVGSGALLSRVLSLVGLHTFVATVTDSGGLHGTSQVAVTVTLLTSSKTATLSATQATLGNGTQRVYLTWTGLSAAEIDEYRNNVKVYSGANRGTVYNNAPAGPGTYYYFVCNSGTTVCTNTVKAVF